MRKISGHGSRRNKRHDQFMVQNFQRRRHYRFVFQSARRLKTNLLETILSIVHGVEVIITVGVIAYRPSICIIELNNVQSLRTYTIEPPDMNCHSVTCIIYWKPCGRIIGGIHLHYQCSYHGLFPSVLSNLELETVLWY